MEIMDGWKRQKRIESERLVAQAKVETNTNIDTTTSLYYNVTYPQALSEYSPRLLRGKPCVNLIHAFLN